MSLLGTRLTLLIGATVPLPAPPRLVEAVDGVTVTHSDEGRSGFEIRLRAGRGATDVLDYGLLADPLLRPCNRVVLVVTFGAVPRVLMDGIITNQQLAAGGAPGTGTLTLTGEDVSLMMDLDERSVEHPAQPEAAIAAKIIASYAQYGLIPVVVPPPTLDVPLPTDRVPVQQGTDLEYLQAMARRYAYVFYVEPGPAPGTNTAYWGPPVRVGLPQRALSVGLGPDTNVTGGVDFRYDGLAPATLKGQVQDRRTNRTAPVQTPVSTRVPLSTQPAWATQRCVRTEQFRQSGLDTAQAYARAQARADASVDRTVTATGTLDAGRYESLLRPRALVGLRGAGYSYDGLYYVRRVSHALRPGSYTQSFTLARDGLGATLPVLPS